MNGKRPEIVRKFRYLNDKKPLMLEIISEYFLCHAEEVFADSFFEDGDQPASQAEFWKESTVSMAGCFVLCTFLINRERYSYRCYSTRLTSSLQTKFSVTLMATFLLITRTGAANHYCVDQNTVRFSMRSDTDQPERLLTNIRNRDRYAASQRCRWELVIRDLTEPRYLMLQPGTQPIRHYVSEEAVQESSSCKSTLTVVQPGSNYSIEWKNGRNIPKHPLLVPVFNSSQKLVTSFTTGDSEPSADCPRVELNIMLVKKGFCGRNMLLHRSHCHLVSDREIGVADLMKTGMRLTPFSSMDDVQQLIRDNNLRMQQYPYNRPLHLSSPVRVGVFRCPGSLQAFYWNSSNGSCVAQPFNSTTISTYCKLTDLHCGSIRVDKIGQIRIEFADCHIPMKTLLSFLETPDEDIGANCQQLTVRFPHDEPKSADESFNRKFFFGLPVVVTAAVLLSSISPLYLLIAFFCRKYRKVCIVCRKDSKASPEEDSTTTRRFPVANRRRESAVLSANEAHHLELQPLAPTVSYV